MAEYKSHRDLQEPGQYALYKNVVQEQRIGGSTICICEDPLSRLAYIKANLGRLGLYAQAQSLLDHTRDWICAYAACHLRKGRPQSCSENLVLTSACGQGMIPRTARRTLTTTKPGTSNLWQALDMAMPLWMTPTTNTRHVSYLQQSHSGLVCDVTSCPFYTDKLLLLLKQEWSRSLRKGFVGPITCIQDLIDFYAWYVQRMSSTANGAVTVSRSWEHISLLGYFHGHIMAGEWQRGRYIPDEAMHGITFRRDITRQANINAKEVAQTADDGYEASDKKYLEDSEMAAISASLWISKSADDCILYNCYSSVGSQTLIRDTELLQLQRMRSSLSESSQYQTSFGHLKLMEVVSKGVQKTNKTSLLYSWMIRRRQIDHLCPFFWVAARLFHDYQRMQPGKPGNQHGGLVEVIRNRPSGMFCAFDALVHGWVCM